MNGQRQDSEQVRIIQNQGLITACAVDIIKAVRKRRGKPLQPRDRMALKLLTPQNSALVVRDGVRSLGCRQVSFDLITDDLGLGCHRLTPAGVHVFNPDRGWWSDQYGRGQFLWNLRLKEDPQAGIFRILDHLFKMKIKGLFGPKARAVLQDKTVTIAGDIDRNLKLFIQREEGSVETTMRRLVKAEAIFSPKDIGLDLSGRNGGHVVLLFGKDKRFGVSFQVEKT